MHMQGEGGLTPGELAHRTVEKAIAISLGDLRVLPKGERVQAGDRRLELERRQLEREGAAQVLELLKALRDIRVWIGAQLQSRPVGLGARVGLELSRQSRHDRVGA
jgi:hypothetical protein